MVLVSLIIPFYKFVMLYIYFNTEKKTSFFQKHIPALTEHPYNCCTIENVYHVYLCLYVYLTNESMQ